MKKLIEGLRKFQTEIFPAHEQLFARLAGGQQPSTLFITCADSRVVPDLFTQAEPGELFVIRNAGNIVPAYGRFPGGVTATIEFAVAALGVRDIVICGHTDCGVIDGLLHPERLSGMPSVAAWLEQAAATRQVAAEIHKGSGLTEPQLLEALVRENVLTQLRNIQTHPAVAAGLAGERLSLHGWVYDIRTGGVEAFDSDEHRFVLIDGSYVPKALPAFRKSGYVPD